MYKVTFRYLLYYLLVLENIYCTFFFQRAAGSGVKAVRALQLKEPTTIQSQAPSAPQVPAAIQSRAPILPQVPAAIQSQAPIAPQVPAAIQSQAPIAPQVSAAIQSQAPEVHVAIQSPVPRNEQLPQPQPVSLVKNVFCKDLPCSVSKIILNLCK